MKLSYGLLSGIVFLILITLANLYAQDPFIIKDPYPGDKYTSNGVSWGDWNNDGYDDVFIGNGAGGYKFEDFLYANNGDGTFTKITGQSIVTEVHLSGGATWGDYDNDGDLDLYITLTEDSFQGTDYKNILYINNNNGTFSKSTTAGPPINEGEYSNTAGWGDYDNDGLLDLFVKNGWQGAKDEHSLYQNNGDGTFTEINAGDMTGSVGASFIAGFAWCDFDMDGDLDIFTCSGVGDNNKLWRNDGGGTFTKVGSFAATAANGASWADFDNDGDFDLFIANYGDGSPEKNDLYENNGDGTFTRRTDLIIVNEASYSLGSAWGDINNDGYLDLFVANDYQYDSNPNFLYINNGNGTFTKNTTSVAVADPMSQAPHGVAFSDYDNDGFLDMFAAVHGPNFFLENKEPENGNTNHWLQLKLVGTTSNTTAIGAKVWVTANISGSTVTQLREVSSQTGMASHNSLRQHFGLGDATTADEVRIEWPSGIVQTLNNVAADQILTVTEGSVSESITVTSPNGGETWEVGSSHAITWTSSGTSGTVKLEYSTNNGSDWTTIEPSTTDGGSYDWTIPNAPSTECLVRVTDTDGDPSDVSNATFTISAPASITVTAPNGGEDWQVGSSQTITWTSENTSGSVKIEYSTNNGSSWTDVIASTTDNGVHEWIIPDDPSSECLIRVTDTAGTPSDQSDALFTIRTALVTQNISFSTGWNWFSINVEDDDMSVNTVLASIEPNGEFIKNQTSFATYYGGTTGWYSSNGLDNIDPKSMYMIKMTSSDMLSFNGTAVDFLSLPISLAAGWNWIGYLPQEANSLNNALSSIEPNGDFIKNQTSFATYYGSPTGWYSSNGLDELRPSDGYMLKMTAADELIYTNPSTGMAKIASTIKDSVDAIWSVDYRKFQHSMAVTGVVTVDGIELNKPSYQVGAFVGEECRGIANLVKFPLNERYEFGMLIYGDMGETITFKVYAPASQTTISALQQLEFKSNIIVGDGRNPYELSLPSVIVGVNEFPLVPKAYELYQNYPNPFNPQTTIAFDLPKDGYVDLDIYDLRGVLVKSILNKNLQAGHFTMKWDGTDMTGRQVPSGLYFYKLTANEFIETRKMILAK